MRIFTGGWLESLLVSMNKNPQSRNNALWINEIIRTLAFPVLALVGISINGFRVSDL